MKKLSRTTMGDIARDTGFSIATVSHVINKTRFVDEKTRQAILEAMKRLNYTGKILQQHPKLIGMIIADIREDFYTEITKSVEASAMENGYSLILCDAEDDPSREELHLQNLLEKGASGIILSPIDRSHPPKLLEQLDIPIILIDRQYNHSPYDTVTINNFAAGREATETLLRNGAQSVGFIGYDDSVSTVCERRRGYEQAVGECGGCIDVLRLEYHRGNYASHSQRSIAEFLRPRKRPGKDAVVCATSHVCFELLNTVKELQLRVPQDLQLATFDENKWFAHIGVPFLVVKQPAVEMGFIAVELLVNKVGNPKKSLRQQKRDIVLDFSLVQTDGGG